MSSDENLEDFAQWVLFLAQDAHPGAKEDTVQQIVVEVFLRGITDKEAARSASDKCPVTIQKALKYVKNSINTQRAIFGKSHAASRQVSFADQTSETPMARAMSPSHDRSPTKSLEVAKLECEFAELKKGCAKLQKQQAIPTPASPLRDPPTPS